MREDVGEVTTSLQRPETSKSRSGMPYDSFEWQQEPPPSNGVPRSAWTRSHRRLSRWHRPYTLILIIMDFLSAILASYLAVTFIQKSSSGFQGRENIFYFVAFVALPLGWLAILWANGSYDRRYLGLGSEEFKRVVRS